MSNCWINGEIMPVTEARISVLDHGILYGDGIFEGIRFYHRKVFRLTDHIKRLFQSAKAIDLVIPYTKQQVIDALDELINAQSLENGYIRLVITRGIGKLGINPDSCETPTMFIIADALEMVSEQKRNEGISLITAATRRMQSDSLDLRIKSLNYLNHIQAKIEANIAGADDALLLNQFGNVAEASVANIFAVYDGVLMTPPVTDGALDGITRKSVLEVAHSLGIPVKEKTMTRYDIYNADECFLSGTGAMLIPVKQLDGRMIGVEGHFTDRPILDQLLAGYKALVKKYCEA